MTTEPINELYGVTKEDFRDYEALRSSGVMNMFGARSHLGWSRDTFEAVLRHYSEMADTWPDVLEEAAASAPQRRRNAHAALFGKGMP